MYKRLRVTAWVSRFVDTLKKRDTMSAPLNAQELQRTKLLSELHIQRRHHRRGIPHQIISDNAQQFKIGLEQDVDEVSKYSTRQGIQWRLIVALAVA